MIQGAVIKAFQEERERSKQPGYVCRYDDYDADYDETYGQIVQDLNSARQATTEGYRTHAPHNNRVANPPHAAPQEARATVGEEPTDRGFGEGIF